jgi:hypothetical protein
LAALLWRTCFEKSTLIMIPKTYSRLALAAAIWLNCLTLAPKILADDISDAVDAFDRDLGLERMGPDIVNVNPQSSAAESSNSQASEKRTAQRQNSRVSRPSLSSDILTFRSSQRVTDSLRGFMIAKVTQNDMTAIPAVEKRFANDVLLHRFDRMFSPYGFSSHNLGDTVAGYLIASWEIINDAGQRQLREQAAQPPLKIGLDLRRMRFTEEGFVK